MLAQGEAAESEAMSQSAAPRGLVRLAVPMSFGVLYIAPLLPDFFQAFPGISIDLHLSDAQVDLIGDGFDAASLTGEDPSLVHVLRSRLKYPAAMIPAATAHARSNSRSSTAVVIVAASICIPIMPGRLLGPSTWRNKGRSTQGRHWSHTPRLTQSNQPS